MANIHAVTASNGAEISDTEGAEFLLDEYDVRPQAEITEDGELIVWGRSPFQVFTDDMSMDECTSEFLKELTGVLDEELVIQSIGAEKCRYPVMAVQYRVSPADGSVNVRNLDRDERPLGRESRMKVRCSECGHAQHQEERHDDESCEECGSEYIFATDGTEDCDHGNRTFKGVDTEEAPEVIYREWRCDDCNALVSDVYESAGRRIVQPPEGKAYTEEVSA